MLTPEHKLCTFAEVQHRSLTTDGLLITGQNPASSGPAAKVLIGMLKKMAK